jgi:hypothetical protein
VPRYLACGGRRSENSESRGQRSGRHDPSFDPYFAAVRQFFNAVRNCPALFLHLHDAGRCLTVDEHWDREVAVREHHDNVRQMRPDRLNVLGVLAVITSMVPPSGNRRK